MQMYNFGRPDVHTLTIRKIQLKTELKRNTHETEYLFCGINNSNKTITLHSKCSKVILSMHAFEFLRFEGHA